MRKKVTLLLLGISLSLVSLTNAQTITLSGKDLPLKKIFSSIREQTGYTVFGNAELLKKGTPVSLRTENMPLAEFLRIVFHDQNLDYELQKDNKNILVFPKAAPSDAKPSAVSITAAFLLTGQITDSAGVPLSHVSVKVKGEKKGVSTDEEGKFRLTVSEGDVLQISSIGYEQKEITLSADKTSLHITLKKQAGELGAVTINAGILTRNKNSFTGAVSTYTGDDLKRIGNQNILQSLKTLDPSFIITPDNQLGSNPNQLPKIELRGKTSISDQTVQTIQNQFTADPNQPLFILNGMETTLQQIVDLDMNRVATITILKDAASTALYGSKAANGVVVVETKRPKAGELQITYNNDTRWEIPALGDYNMMNAKDLLQYQVLAGRYLYLNNSGSQRDIDALYNQRLTAVEQGVNSYWLNVPLRQGLTMGHSLALSGGTNELLYEIDLNYKKQDGVMKGSDRNTWGGAINLTYRKNKVNVSNQLYINGTRSDESPYGSFTQYVGMAPYYKKKRADGSLNTDKYLEEFIPSQAFSDTLRVGNPLYNASLNAKDQTNLLTIQDQLNAIWDLTRNWRLSGAFQLNKGISNTDQFTPAANTLYDYVPVQQKGDFTNIRQETWGYQTNLMLTYNQVLNGVHSINGNLRTELQENNTTGTGYEAVGFPDGVAPNPAFAFSYLPFSKPPYAAVTTRQVSTLGSINYAYAGKYLVDATYRLDGSTVFGSAKKYSPFWSAGLGWVLSRESFLKEANWLNTLRLRADVGTSGNQQLGTFASASVFTLENNPSVFGQGLYITTLGNENLQWQNTRSTNLGMDLSACNRRINATLNVYEKVSKPLIVAGSAPASTGVSTYPLNVGELRTRGAEAILRFDLISKPKDRILWSVGLTGSFYKSKYEGFGNILKNLNDSAQRLGADIQSKAVTGPDAVVAALQRYLDGYSPDELWAVRSAGIDPATGKEVYIKRNGEKTYVYDPTDVAPIGNGRPQVEGVISSNLTIKGLQIGVNLRYSLNNYIFNTALYQKVENIGFADLDNNQDRRALDLRWKKPGDVTQFRGISETNFAPMSSRFIQKESFLSGESFNVSYELRDTDVKWLHKTGLKTARISAYMNDIFRLSNILAERGTDYPFSKSVSFNLNLFF